MHWYLGTYLGRSVCVSLGLGLSRGLQATRQEIFKVVDVSLDLRNIWLCVGYFEVLYMHTGNDAGRSDADAFGWRFISRSPML